MSRKFNPVVARMYANAVLNESMDWLQDELGIVDFEADLFRGGDYVEIPRHRSFTSFGGISVSGSLTTPPKRNTEVAVVRHIELHSEWISAAKRLEEGRKCADMTDEEFACEVGFEIGKAAGNKLLLDIRVGAIAAADSVAADHYRNVYVDSWKEGRQEYLSAYEVEMAKLLMGDQIGTMDIGMCHTKQWDDLKKSCNAEKFDVPITIQHMFPSIKVRRVRETIWIIDNDMPVAAGPTSASPSKYRALLFRSRTRAPDGWAPVVVSQCSPPIQVGEDYVIGAEGVKFKDNPKMSHAIGFRGKAWDVVNGGPNPLDSIFGISHMWDDAYVDHRQVGIVLLETN